MFGTNSIVGKKFFADSDKLLVTSMFLTLQGEGLYRHLCLSPRRSARRLGRRGIARARRDRGRIGPGGDPDRGVVAAQRAVARPPAGENGSGAPRGASPIAFPAGYGRSPVAFLEAMMWKICQCLGSPSFVVPG